ncbi:hypothetical protein [Streptosporangium sp. NPDC048865]|uniref:hypothetical protein n=1 Tax=Streptosporangium sp. NPDC048865 TaxID=3155766 RepID=UPI0034487309
MQYVAAAPHHMHGLPVLVIVQDAIIKCVVDRSKIDHRMLAVLEKLATDVASTLGLRDIPSAEPWGRASLPLVDSYDPSALVPVISPAGIVCPLPRGLITVDLAHALEKLTDNTLRLYRPPPI